MQHTGIVWNLMGTNVAINLAFTFRFHHKINFGQVHTWVNLTRGVF